MLSNPISSEDHIASSKAQNLDANRPNQSSAPGVNQFNTLQYSGRNVGKAVFTSKQQDDFQAAQMLNTLNKNSEYNALANSSFVAPALQKKTKGFVDFDLQLFRPDGTQNANAHEKRFEPYNYFPKNISNNKPVPQVEFDKCLPRSGKMLYTMSDSLYDPKQHLPIVQQKDKGILQFSTIRDKRGDLEKRMAKLKEYRSTKDDALRELLQEIDPVNQHKKKAQYQWVIENDKSVAMSKVIPRVPEEGENIQKNTNEEKEKVQLRQYMPVHMTNNNGRYALNQLQYQSYVANGYRKRPFLDPVSTLNTRKDFHYTAQKKNKEQAKAHSVQHKAAKKKNLTFNQLLSKFGYIQDEGVGTRKRERPWQIQKRKARESDSSDSD